MKIYIEQRRQHLVHLNVSGFREQFAVFEIHGPEFMEGVKLKICPVSALKQVGQKLQASQSL
jgi:hypothetical protein